MIQSVFVILPSEDNACIFFGQIDQEDTVDDLGNILGVIVEYASRLSDAQMKNIRISQGKFAYGRFGKIYLILKIQASDEMDEIKPIMENMAKGFISNYKDALEKNNPDPSQYEDFSGKIMSYLETKSKPTVKPEITQGIKKETVVSAPPKEIPVENITTEQEKADPYKDLALKKGKDLLKTPEPIEYKVQSMPEVEKLEGEKPIIQPEKRDAYPNGIDEYMVDEVMWNESQAVMKEYTADFVDGIIAKLQIFLSISITHHYEIIIDFQNYPEKPILEASESMNDDVLSLVTNASYFLKQWDSKLPPHIVEIVREVEKILTKMKTMGKLEANADMPSYMMPELEPLEDLPPLPKSAYVPKEPIDIPEPEPLNIDNTSPVNDSSDEKKNSAPVDEENKKKALEQQKNKDEDKNKKAQEKELEKMKKLEEKERKKQLKLEKKADQKRLKEIMKEADEDAKKESKEF